MTHYETFLQPVDLLRNRMVTRCCILISMCCMLGIAFILEQPASSVLQWHPDFQLLCKRYNIYRVSRFREDLHNMFKKRQSNHLLVDETAIAPRYSSGSEAMVGADPCLEQASVAKRFGLMEGLMVSPNDLNILAHKHT